MEGKRNLLRLLVVVVFSNAFLSEDGVVPSEPGLPERVLPAALREGLENVKLILGEEKLSLIIASHVPGGFLWPLDGHGVGNVRLISLEGASLMELSSVRPEGSGRVSVSSILDIDVDLLHESAPELWDRRFARVFQSENFGLSRSNCSNGENELLHL